MNPGRTNLAQKALRRTLNKVKPPTNLLPPLRRSLNQKQLDNQSLKRQLQMGPPPPPIRTAAQRRYSTTDAPQLPSDIPASIQRRNSTSLTLTRGLGPQVLLAPKIELNPLETEICNLLRDYTNYYNTRNTPPEPLTLRITGGWVRDKLLGQGSHDLDIAVNIMSGVQFATGLNAFLTMNHEKYGILPHSIHKIEKNPERSKHLETATTKLFGVEVDFVNLRSEVYTESSRIPQVTYGTPLEDALRRDATLNALFYNIQLDSIEDFTGRGLRDLASGVIATPLPPHKTFLDDPLRVLRLIRFASRFKFRIEEDVMRAMADKEINYAFFTKISRERIGAEMERIIQGPNPLIALKLIQLNHLENVIFFWHHDANVIKFNEDHLPEYKERVLAVYDDGILNAHIKRLVHNFKDILKYLPEINPRNYQNFMLAVTLLPFSKLKIIALPKKKTNNQQPVVENIIKEGLKMNKPDAILVAHCVDNVDKYHEKLLAFTENKGKLKRSELGSFLRLFEGNWRLMHDTALVHQLLSLPPPDLKRKEEIGQMYSQFHDYIIEQGLDTCHELKPMIKGVDLLRMARHKPGPWMSKVNHEIILWQLDHPGGTEEELVSYVEGILPRYTSVKNQEEEE